MREGIICAANIGDSAIERMVDSEDYDSGAPVAIIGAPFNNELYYDSGISKKANIYTRIGGYSWWGNAFDLGAWKGIMKNRLGYKMNYCDDQTYNLLCEDERVLQMPSYPEKGCYELIDGINVIKISNPQKP